MSRRSHVLMLFCCVSLGYLNSSRSKRRLGEYLKDRKGRIEFPPTYKYSCNSDFNAGDTIKSKRNENTNMVTSSFLIKVYYALTLLVTDITFHSKPIKKSLDYKSQTMLRLFCVFSFVQIEAFYTEAVISYCYLIDNLKFTGVT